MKDDDERGRLKTTLTITGKGQVTLKQDLLRQLGVGRGEKVEIDKLPDGQIVVRAATQNGRITNFIGCLSRKAGETNVLVRAAVQDDAHQARRAGRVF